MTIQPATVDPRLAGLPAEVADAVAALLSDHEARIAEHRAALLPAGGVVAERVDLQDGSRPAHWGRCADLLDRAAAWYGEALAVAVQLVSMSAEDDDEAALRAAAGDLLAEPIRARVHVCAAYAALNLATPEHATGPRVEADGTVTVAGARVQLTAAAIASPPYADAKITLSIGQGSDPAAVAAELRRLADRVATDGAYPLVVSGQ